MNKANTNTQAGQDLQSLQPQSNQTQQTASGFQPGSGSGLTGSNAIDRLNQGVSTDNLSVAVASSGSQTTIPPITSAPSQGTFISPVFFAVVLVLAVSVILLAAYRRARSLSMSTADIAAEDFQEETIRSIKIKDKKKRKKPKKAHHH